MKVRFLRKVLLADSWERAREVAIGAEETVLDAVGEALIRGGDAERVVEEVPQAIPNPAPVRAADEQKPKRKNRGAAPENK